jgi:hypothetical protein
MYTNLTTQFPNQRLPLTQKGKEWRERHLKWAENVRYSNNGKIRKSLLNKKINFDLYGGKLHLSDIKMYLNPYNKVSSYIPDKIQHYPVMNQALDLLTGEEVNRKSEMTVKVANAEAISQVEETKAKQIRELLLEFVSKDIPEGQEQQEASDLIKYANYKYQDLREIHANWVLNDAIKSTDFYRKLQEGFKHVTICAEEIYLFDIVSGEPVMELLNPKKVYTFRAGQSSRIEDSDVIIIDDYWSIGRVHDTFYNKLKPAHLASLDSITGNMASGSGNQIWIDDTRGYISLPSDDPSENLIDGFLGYANELGLPHSDYIDMDGNVRVLRIYWKSQRKLLKLKRYDFETGDTIEEFVSENYTPNKTYGEEVETYWVNEWWQGTKIGKDIYIEIKPKELQYRRNSNPSICHPGIVGQVYNTNQMRAQSMVDKMKPLQYFYDATMDRLNKLLANHVGKVAEIDLAKVAWDDMDKWLHFIRTENIAYLNSFKESNKGVASGQFNTVGGHTIDLDQSAAIEFYMNMLEYFRRSMYDIVGITPQRLGEVSNRETVGGVERSVTQSSHVTAELFAVHDNVKKRCAEILMETAKYAVKGNKFKAQSVSSEGVTIFMDIDGDDLLERDYSIYVENDLDLNGLRQKIEGLAQAWSQQSDIVRPSTLLSIFEDKSIGSIRQKLLDDENAKMKRDNEQFQQNLQQQQQDLQARSQKEQVDIELKQQELQLKDLMNQRDNSTLLQIKMMEMQANSGENNTGEIEKLQLQKEKLDKEIELKQEQFNRTLQETIRSNKAKEQEATRHNQKLESKSTSKTK